MKKIFRQETLIAEGRYFWASAFILLVCAMLSLRLWYVQIFRGDHYRTIADRNRIRRIEVPAPRGQIYDAHGQLLLGNRPFYDLVLIPQYAKDTQKTFSILSRLLNIPDSQFHRRVKQSQGRPKFLPISLKRNLSLHDVSIVESNKIFLPGIDVMMVPRRDYNDSLPSHIAGYLGEITAPTLKEVNKKSKDNPYFMGDLVGKQGLESRWEDLLRGRRGYRVIQVDAFGRQSDKYLSETRHYLEQDAIPGANLQLTLDAELQKATREAFQGKNGAVIVVDPRNGAILSMISEPGFDPTIYQDGISQDNWKALTMHPFTPLLDKTTGGEFAPGSTYKSVVALAALMEGVINSNTKHTCRGSFTLGNKVYGCHERGGHGVVDLRTALMRSCDVYFYQVGVELGVDRIAKYARDLGLGTRLGFALNMERPGLIPTSEWKLNTLKQPWSVGDTPSLSIGQSYNLTTPLQLVNLYATLANGGKVYRPYMVSKVVSYLGENKFESQPELIHSSSIKPEYFGMIRDMLKDVVMHPSGTGKNARVQGTTVAGKTGSVQVVSLKKNNNKMQDVSVKWKEHAMFAAFSPAENAEVAIAVISEHDRVGGGGASAAPVAGKILEAYYRIKEERKIRQSSIKNISALDAKKTMDVDTGADGEIPQKVDSNVFEKRGS